MLPGRLFRNQGQRCPHPNGLGRLGPEQVVRLGNMTGILFSDGRTQGTRPEAHATAQMNTLSRRKAGER